MAEKDDGLIIADLRWLERGQRSREYQVQSVQHVRFQLLRAAAARQFYESSASVLYASDFPLQLALEWLCLWVQLAIVAGDVSLCLKIK